ncbi:hypothetical protein C8J56DRAFT_896325 [Mycena floridula]|nr:hypothetical protein C8J56DRAFT_896325 [Mycena floridula]
MKRSQLSPDDPDSESDRSGAEDASPSVDPAAPQAERRQCAHYLEVTETLHAQARSNALHAMVRIDGLKDQIKSLRAIVRSSLNITISTGTRLNQCIDLLNATRIRAEQMQRTLAQLFRAAKDNWAGRDRIQPDRFDRYSAEMQQLEENDRNAGEMCPEVEDYSAWFT